MSNLNATNRPRRSNVIAGVMLNLTLVVLVGSTFTAFTPRIA